MRFSSSGMLRGDLRVSNSASRKNPSKHINITRAKANTEISLSDSCVCLIQAKC